MACHWRSAIKEKFNIKCINAVSTMQCQRPNFYGFLCLREFLTSIWMFFSVIAELPVKAISAILYFKRACVSISIFSCCDAPNCKMNISPLLKFTQLLTDNWGYYTMLTINIRPQDVTMWFQAQLVAEHVTVITASPSSNRCSPASQT